MISSVILVIILVIIALILLFRDTYYKPFTRIVSWNIRFFGMENTNDHTLSYYQTIAQRIKTLDPQIVCLQEISSAKGLEHLMKYLSDYDVFIDPDAEKNNILFFEEMGYESLYSKVINNQLTSDIVNNLMLNCILVKRNIRIVSFDVLHKRQLRISYYDKYIGDNVVVYNVHLPSDHISNRSQERLAILNNLTNAIDNNEEKYVVVAGDFNADYKTKEVQYIQHQGLVHSNEVVNRLYYKSSDVTGMDLTFSHRRKENENLRRLDHFFVSQDLSNHIIGGFTDNSYCAGNMGDILGEISDHCMIALDIR